VQPPELRRPLDPEEGMRPEQGAELGGVHERQLGPAAGCVAVRPSIGAS
jgi:hypothetical protein